MTPTEERLAITIEAILGFYPTGDAERDRQSAAVIAKALLDELDIDRIERGIDAMLDAVHPETYAELILTNPGEWEASVWMPGLDWSCEEPTATGGGTTRTAAIADACKRALEEQGNQ